MKLFNSLLDYIKDFYQPMKSKKTETKLTDNWVTVKIWQSKIGEKVVTKSNDLLFKLKVLEDTLGVSNKSPTKRNRKKLNKKINQERCYYGHVAIDIAGLYASFRPDLQFFENPTKNYPNIYKWCNPSSPLPKNSHALQYLCNKLFGISGLFADRKKDGDIPKNTEDSFTRIFYTLDVNAMKESYRYLKQDALFAIKGSKVNAKGYSCTSFAFTLLKDGGITKLSNKCQELANRNLFFNPLKPSDLTECIKDAKKNEELRYPETKNLEPRIKF